MLKFIVILLFGLVLEAVGVVLLSRGLKEIGELQRVTVAEMLRLARNGVTNPHILFGVAFEAAFFGILLFLLSRAEVSLVWPLTSLGFVVTAIAAKFYLHEQVTGLRWTGVALIVLGAGLISWSDQSTKKTTPPPPAVAPGNATP